MLLLLLHLCFIGCAPLIASFVGGAGAERLEVDRAGFSLVGVLQRRILARFLRLLLLLGGRRILRRGAATLGSGACGVLLSRREHLLRVVLLAVVSGCATWTPSGTRRALRRSIYLGAVHLSVGVVEDPGGLGEVDEVDVLAHELGDHLANVMHLGEGLEQGNHLEKAAVVGVVIPRKNWHCVLVVEVIGVWRVIDYDNVFHFATEQRQILNVAALEAEAVLAVEAHRDELVLVERVDQRIGVDAHGGRVEDYLVNTGQFLQEKEDAGADQHVDLDGSALDHDSHLKIAAASRPARPQVRLTEFRMDKRFVQIEHQRLTSTELRCLRLDHGVFLGHGLLAKPSCPLKLKKLLLGEY